MEISHSQNDIASDTCQTVIPRVWKSGKDKIRERLELANGQWVSAWDLSRIAIEYKRPIWQLRHQDGLIIENKTERINGKVHGSYRLVSKQPALLTIARTWQDPEAQR